MPSSLAMRIFLGGGGWLGCMVKDCTALGSASIAAGVSLAAMTADLHLLDPNSVPTDLGPLAVFARHRTVRRFAPTPLREGDLARLLWAAQRAPSDATAQMYSFLRLHDPALRQKVAEISKNPHIATAAEAFLVLADVRRLRQILEAKGYVFGTWPAAAVHFAIGDAVLAGENLLLAAEMLGYAGCWIGGIMGGLPEIRDLCALPTGVLPFAALVIGVAAETPAMRPRLQPELILHQDHYRDPSPAEIEAALMRMAPITSRGDWGQSLARYFAVGGTMEARDQVLRQVLREQGFDHVTTAPTLPTLDEIVAKANALGFGEVLVRAKNNAFEAWIDQPDRAHRGDGATPSAALAAALADLEASP
jgi:FMN reductase (NADPH)